MAKKKKNRNRWRRGPAQGSAKTAVEFWGSADRLPAVQRVKVTSDADALARSLGRPPFTGHEAASEHYLRAVYQNTVKLAEALATAGDIAEVDAPEDGGSGSGPPASGR